MLHFFLSLIRPIYPEYHDKRDKDGVLLYLCAYKLISKLIEKEFQKIEKKKEYQNLIHHFDKSFLKSFYLKSLRELFDNDCHIIVSKNYNNLFTIDNLINNLNFEQIIYNYRLRNKIINFIRFLKFILSFAVITKSNFFKKLDANKIKEPKIGVSFAEGLNPNKRSDIFWLNESKLKPEQIIIYGHDFKKLFSELDKLYHHNDFNVSDKLKKLLFLDLKKFKPSKIPDLYKHLLNQIKINQSRNYIDTWFFLNTKDLLKKIHYWEQVFSQYNIRVHIDNSEDNIECIIKQIALKKIGGISVGKVRSYPMKYYFDDFYPKDIFFCWGEDSQSELKKSNNPIKNLIISGLPYSSNTKNFQDNKISFRILVLDNTHSYNNKKLQLLYTPTLKNFYEKLFDFLLKNSNIEIFVKPKKVTDIPVDKKLILEIRKSKRFHVYDDGGGQSAVVYSKDVDLVISTSVYMPSAMMECVAIDKRCIFYDYAKLSKDRSDIYSWGYNKVIFDEIDMVIKKLNNFLDKPEKNKKFGCWKKIIDEIDPFRDNKGAKRIGFYIKLLVDEFKKGKKPIEIIDLANQKYYDEINKNYKSTKYNKKNLIIRK